MENLEISLTKKVKDLRKTLRDFRRLPDGLAVVQHWPLEIESNLLCSVSEILKMRFRRY